jgi:hypothetical protein
VVGKKEVVQVVEGMIFVRAVMTVSMVIVSVVIVVSMVISVFFRFITVMILILMVIGFFREDPRGGGLFRELNRRDRCRHAGGCSCLNQAHIAKGRGQDRGQRGPGIC